MLTKRYHWIVDIDQCQSAINDPQALITFVKEAVDAIGMHILEGPIIAKGLETNPGWSIIAIIDYSHISLHTFTESQEALIDVFSCRPYEKAKLLELCMRYFSTKVSFVREKEVWWG